MAASAVLNVTSRPSLVKDNTDNLKPAHHLDDSKSAFVNPWPSFRPHKSLDLAKAGFTLATQSHDIPDDVEARLRLQTPTWGLDRPEASKMKATWLGHACFLLELPSPAGAARGARILFDPVFSHRCSPFQFMGPARYTKPPCKLEEIPSVDIVVISHNHYDHMDTESLQTLEKLFQPHVFAPLGNESYLLSIGIPKDRAHCRDWWEGMTVMVDVGQAIQGSFNVTCTPAQHFTGRGIFDRFKTLWASWAIEDTVSKRKVWFGGDTGYRTIFDGEDIDSLPVCPEFRRIGETFDGFDLAMIPIGAYIPRAVTSSVHCSPEDSVAVFKDIRAKRAVGMHWGTWVLTLEAPLDPPKRLAEECERAGIDKGAFDICGLGETVFI